MSCCGGNCACASGCKCGSDCGGGNMQNSKWSAPSHEVFKYLVPLLVALVAIKCQAKGEDPFETRPINIWCFGVAKCIYCLAIGIMNQMQTRVAKYYQISDHVVLVSGILSSVSLASILFPRFPGQLIFVVLTVLLIVLARNMINRAYYWVYNGVTKVITLILTFKNWFARQDTDTIEQPNPSPPV